MHRVRLSPRSVLSVGVAALAVLALACAPPPQPPTPTTTTSTTESTTSTTEPTTTTSESTTTTTESTTTTSTTTTSSTTTSTTTTSTTTTQPPQPVNFPILASCRTTVSLGFLGTQTSDSELDSGVTALAPATASAGSTFQVQLTADPIDVPTESGGYAIVNLNTVGIRFDVPTGSSFVGATLSGGSNLGPGTPTVGLVGGQVRLSVPGPLTPGTTAVLPTVTVTLQATGAAGQSIETRLAGSSFSNPGITFTARIDTGIIGQVNGPTNCFPVTSPTLTSTQIV